MDSGTTLAVATLDYFCAARKVRCHMRAVDFVAPSCEIQFNVQLAQNGKPLVFHLHWDGDHMKGEASGDMQDGPVKVAIDVTPRATS